MCARCQAEKISELSVNSLFEFAEKATCWLCDDSSAMNKKIGGPKSPSAPVTSSFAAPKPAAAKAATKPAPSSKTSPMGPKDEMSIGKGLALRMRVATQLAGPRHGAAPVATAGATKTIVASGRQPVSPEVKKAIEEIEKYPDRAKSVGLVNALSTNRSNSPQDVAFRKELMQALGPTRVAEFLSAEKRETKFQDTNVAAGILAASAESFSPAEQGQVAAAVGAEGLKAVLTEAVNAASDPTGSNEEKALRRSKATQLAQLVGNLASLPDGSPGKAEAADALKKLIADPHASSGVSNAAWLVSRSGNDTLRQRFAANYIEEFKKDPKSLSPEEARAVAWVLGSVEGSKSTSGVESIVNLSADQRTLFLSQMTQADLYPADLNNGYEFQVDLKAGVNEFLTDIARINPANFKDAQAAKDLRVEAFQRVSLASDNGFFESSPGTHAALANLFANGTADIVNASADGNSRYLDVEGRAMAKFFDKVAFGSESARHLVTGALEKYLGTGSSHGLVDELAEHKGDATFMKNGGNIMARNMGFVLGALYQGAQGALSDIDSDIGRKKAVVQVFGSLVESAIEASPVKGAYAALKSGTSGKADVDAVFKFLGERFTQSDSANRDAVKKLGNAILAKAWDQFFSDDTLSGANAEDLNNMFALINAGVARADGIDGQPGVNVGGAPLPTR